MSSSKTLNLYLLRGCCKRLTQHCHWSLWWNVYMYCMCFSNGHGMKKYILIILCVTWQKVRTKFIFVAPKTSRVAIFQAHSVSLFIRTTLDPRGEDGYHWRHIPNSQGLWETKAACSEFQILNLTRTSKRRTVRFTDVGH